MFDLTYDSDKFNVAVVTNIDYDTAVENRSSLKRVLAESGILCLRINKKITKDEFAAFAELFNPIKDPIGKTKSGDLYQYSPKRQSIDAGYVLTEADKEKFGMKFGGLDEQRPGLFETYHCDDTYTETPAQFTILNARALPPTGGGPTHFIDMRRGYDLLDAETKTKISNHKVNYAYNNQNAFPPRIAAEGEAECLIDVHHPLVRTHPVTHQKALFVDLDRATGIVDQALNDGRALLQQLQDHAEANAPTCHHDWQEYDILIWDNASVQHKAQGNFKVGEPRRFWRHLIEGPKPV